MTFPKAVCSLDDPIVWVADTAATVHNTPNRIGIKVMATASEDDVLTIRNGESMEESVIGNITGILL